MNSEDYILKLEHLRKIVRRAKENSRHRKEKLKNTKKNLKRKLKLSEAKIKNIDGKLKQTQIELSKCQKNNFTSACTDKLECLCRVLASFHPQNTFILPIATPAITVSQLANIISVTPDCNYTALFDVEIHEMTAGVALIFTEVTDPLSILDVSRLQPGNYNASITAHITINNPLCATVLPVSQTISCPFILQ